MIKLEKWMKRRDVEVYLELAPFIVDKWKERSTSTTTPILEEGKKVDVLSVCNYILARSDKGRPMPGLKDRATQTIAKLSSIKELPPIDSAKELATDANTSDSSPFKKRGRGKSRGDTSKGLESALSRIQTLEVELAERCRCDLDDPATLTNNINNWQKMLEVLRKTELDVLKVLQEKKVLIRIEDAVRAYEKGILPVKQKLQSLPVQLSVLLENQPSGIIQEVLEKEITKTLLNIANIWEEEKEEEVE